MVGIYFKFDKTLVDEVLLIQVFSSDSTHKLLLTSVIRNWLEAQETFPNWNKLHGICSSLNVYYYIPKTSLQIFNLCVHNLGILPF